MFVCSCKIGDWCFRARGVQIGAKSPSLAYDDCLVNLVLCLERLDQAAREADQIRQHGGFQMTHHRQHDSPSSHGIALSMMMPEFVADVCSNRVQSVIGQFGPDTPCKRAGA